MIITIDTDKKTLSVDQHGELASFDLYSNDAFSLLGQQWLKVGWNQKYPYTFTWFGRPIIQLPEDLIRLQEVIHKIRPNVIIETGVAHGGGLVFYASLLKAMDINGRVIGVDVEIRPHNQAALDNHPLRHLIELVVGSSTDPEIVGQIRSSITTQDRVLVVLDSNHTRAHVRAELESYHSLVTPGSYLVVTDGIMKDLADVPRGNPEWLHDNPVEAAQDFAASHSDFVLEAPAWPFNESTLSEGVSHWPSAWLLRRPSDSGQMGHE